MEAATNKQAQDIVLLDTQEVCSFADYFVMSSGESNRQIKAIRDEIHLVLKKAGQLPHHEEGSADSGWLLMDYGAVVIHVFAPIVREFYELEKLWEKGNCLVRIQ